MARTAPAPNIPAIPGMNPGAFVMGGGGDGGGSGGDGGGAGGGGAGGGPGKGGNGAGGGGKGAGSCGPGSGAGCPNPAHGGKGGTAAGDPVDPITGRVYTVAITDLALPGAMPFVIQRAYSTAVKDDDFGLGFGWMHSLAWTIIETRRGAVRVLDPLGAPTLATTPKIGETLSLPCGRLHQDEAGYVLDTGDGLLRVFLRVHATGGRYRLSRVADRNGNAITLFYGAAGLETIQDSVGRIVRVRRHSHGRIAAFEVKNASDQGRWTAFRYYEYDDRGHLVASLDAAGRSESFMYDEDHRLLSRTSAAGLRAQFRYDQAGRCVETWCDRTAGESGLDASVPLRLADGVTKARGFLHVRIAYYSDFSEVITSRSVRRIDGNRFGKAEKIVWAGGVHTQGFDDVGRLVGYCDATGAGRSWERDAAGRLTREIGPLGETTEYTYDERGFLAELRDPAGGLVRYHRDERGNLLSFDDNVGQVATFKYDERGLLIEGTMPNGGITKMTYDGLANRTLVVEPDGSSREIRYDFLGRVLSFTDERGFETRYGYDADGRVQTVRAPSGATSRYDYDADGDLVRITNPDGRSTVLVRGGYHVVTAVVRPDGTRVAYHYDREQDLTRIVNEAGDEHLFERDGEGRVLSERTFDGRLLRYRHDAQGRIVRVGFGGNEFLDLAYDAAGRLLERKHSDDRTEAYEYDPLGRLASVTSNDVTCRWAYDRRGGLARQETTYGGRTHVVETAYDAMGKRTTMQSSLGARGEMKNDIMGRPVEVHYGDKAPIHLRYDAASREIARLLPGGGRVETEITPDALPSRRAVLGPARARVSAAGEPMWVGAQRGDETLLQSFTWTPGRNLLAIEDALTGRTEIAYEANGRVAVRKTPSRAPEVFGYSPSGDLYEITASGAGRTYAKGGRVVERQGVTYRYDERGRMIEKSVPGAGGAAQRWSFEWASLGLLSAVESPSGERIEFTYDPFARRLEKRVREGAVITAITRYAWDGGALLGSSEERLRTDGGISSEERSYAYVPGSLVPSAQRVRRDGQEAPWEHLLPSCTNAFPEALLGGDGTIRRGLAASLHGQMSEKDASATDIRFPGQLADRETGLYYNQFRYFDPQTGTYLSPELLGLEGSLLAYAYADHSPLRGIDPNGLYVRSTVSGDAGSFDVDSGPQNEDRPLHPAVAAALPIENGRDPFIDPNTKTVTGKPISPTNCGDPHAFSDYLNSWEKQNGKRCDPATPDGRKNLGSALNSIDSFKSTQSGSGAKAGPRAPCPNCSQTISRLYGLAGQDPPGADVLQPGRTTYGGPNDPSQLYESPQSNSAMQAALNRGESARMAEPNRSAYDIAAQQAGWGNPPGAAQQIPAPGDFGHGR
jgi:RHS repeat-associated protein